MKAYLLSQRKHMTYRIFIIKKTYRVILRTPRTHKFMFSMITCLCFNSYFPKKVSIFLLNGKQNGVVSYLWDVYTSNIPHEITNTQFSSNLFLVKEIPATSAPTAIQNVPT